MRGLRTISSLAFAACAHKPCLVVRVDPTFVPLGRTEDPAALLGREVAVGRCGDVRVAPARRPGCAVEMQPEADTSRVSGMKRYNGVAYLGGSLQGVGLDARVTEASGVDYDVANLRRVAAYVHGDCGASVVRRVYVGGGRVRFVKSETASVDANAAGIVRAGGGEKSELLHEVRFADAGYAIEIGAALAASADLRVEVALPSATLRDREQVEFSVWANQPAFVIVASLAADGQAYVLVPNQVRDQPRTDAGGRIAFPTPEEKAQNVVLVAGLPEGVAETGEKMWALAFLDDWAFREVAPVRSRSDLFTVVPTDELKRRVQAVRARLTPGRLAEDTRPYRVVR